MSMNDVGNEMERSIDMKSRVVAQAVETQLRTALVVMRDAMEQELEGRVSARASSLQDRVESLTARVEELQTSEAAKKSEYWKGRAHEAEVESAQRLKANQDLHAQALKDANEFAQVCGHRDALWNEMEARNATYARIESHNVTMRIFLEGLATSIPALLHNGGEGVGGEPVDELGILGPGRLQVLPNRHSAGPRGDSVQDVTPKRKAPADAYRDASGEFPAITTKAEAQAMINAGASAEEMLQAIHRGVTVASQKVENSAETLGDVLLRAGIITDDEKPLVDAQYPAPTGFETITLGAGVKPIRIAGQFGLGDIGEVKRAEKDRAALDIALDYIRTAGANYRAEDLENIGQAIGVPLDRLAEAVNPKRSEAGLPLLRMSEVDTGRLEEYVEDYQIEDGDEDDGPCPACYGRGLPEGGCGCCGAVIEPTPENPHAPISFMDIPPAEPLNPDMFPGEDFPSASTITFCDGCGMMEQNCKCKPWKGDVS